VIEVSVIAAPDRLADISEGAAPPSVEFTYDVTWSPTTVQYDDRLGRYERFPLDPVHLEIHWFSIVNSCVTVLLLTGFLATILVRVLKADFVKFSRGDHEAGGAGADEDEAGWKYVHGDAFRPPPRRALFAAFVGTGTQMLALAAFVFALALVGTFYPYNRGALFTALIVLYALTACVAGHVAASLYRQLGGEQWAPAIVLTAVVYCGPFFLMFCFLNTVAIVYRSTAALPFGTIVIILVIWGLVTIPLTVFGGIAGKNSKTEFDAPCRCVCFFVVCCFVVGGRQESLTPPPTNPPPLKTPLKTPSNQTNTAPTSTRARSPTCPGTAARCRRCSWRAFCPSRPSTSSSTMCLRRCGATRSMSFGPSSRSCLSSWSSSPPSSPSR
jgi:hypothetical protein